MIDSMEIKASLDLTITRLQGCRDARTDFCQVRPIVNIKAFKNDY